MQFLKTIRRLAEAYQSFEQISSKHVRTLGLTPGQFDVIATLGNQPPMTCGELAKKTLMVKGNITVILDGLAKKGLIAKEANPNDGRSLIIKLTPLGEETFEKVFPEHLEFITPLAQQFDERSLKKLNKYLEFFTQEIDKFAELNNRSN